MDTHLSTVSNRLNVVMKQLTIIATIFLPLSFLTGFFGQNFAFLVRWIGSTWSFWVLAVGLDVVTVVVADRAVPPPGLDGWPDGLTLARAAGGVAVSARPEEQSGRPCGRSAVWAS